MKNQKFNLEIETLSFSATVVNQSPTYQTICLTILEILKEYKTQNMQIMMK